MMSGCIVENTWRLPVWTGHEEAWKARLYNARTRWGRQLSARSLRTPEEIAKQKKASL